MTGSAFVGTAVKGDSPGLPEAIFTGFPPKTNHQKFTPERISLFRTVFPWIQDSCVFLPLSTCSHAPALSAGLLINWATGCCFCRLIASGTRLNFPSRTSIKKPLNKNNTETKSPQPYGHKGMERKGKPREKSFPRAVCLLFVRSHPFRWQQISPFQGCFSTNGFDLSNQRFLLKQNDFFLRGTTFSRRAKGVTPPLGSGSCWLLALSLQTLHEMGMQYTFQRGQMPPEILCKGWQSNTLPSRTSSGSLGLEVLAATADPRDQITVTKRPFPCLKI